MPISVLSIWSSHWSIVHELEQSKATRFWRISAFISSKETINSKVIGTFKYLQDSIKQKIIYKKTFKNSQACQCGLLDPLMNDSIQQTWRPQPHPLITKINQNDHKIKSVYAENSVLALNHLLSRIWWTRTGQMTNSIICPLKIQPLGRLVDSVSTFRHLQMCGTPGLYSGVAISQQVDSQPSALVSPN